MYSSIVAFCNIIGYSAYSVDISNYVFNSLKIAQYLQLVESATCNSTILTSSYIAF